MSRDVHVEERLGQNRVRGRVRTFEITESGFWCPKTAFKKNLVVNEWGASAIRLLALGLQNYRISRIYLEFMNVATRGDTVDVPPLDRTRGVDYYNGLTPGTSNRDFLRLSLRGTMIGSSNPVAFPKGNQGVFSARSMPDSVGANGLAFGYDSLSVVYGAALVASPFDDDPTQDIIISACYFADEDQQPKLSVSQIGIEWELTLA